MTRIEAGDFVRVREHRRVAVAIGYADEVRLDPRWRGWMVRVRALEPGSDAYQWHPMDRLEIVPTLDAVAARRRRWLDWYVPHLMRHVGLTALAVAERVGLLPDDVRAIERAAPAGAGVP